MVIVAAALFAAGRYIADTEGRYDEALEDPRRSQELDPSGIDTYIQIGNTYYRAGKLTEAANSFRHVIALQPKIGSVHYRLGLVNLRQNDAAAALDEMQHEPDADFHALGVPMALYALGRRDEADTKLAAAEKSAIAGAAYQIAIAYAARHDMARTLRGEPRYQVLLFKMHF